VLARLRLPAAPRPAGPPPGPGPGPDGERPVAGQPRTGFRDVLRDKAFLRVWALTALLVTASFGQSQSSFPGYATRPGGIGTHGLALAFAANTARRPPAAAPGPPGRRGQPGRVSIRMSPVRNRPARR
jgi:hypothetical protein